MKVFLANLGFQLNSIMVRFLTCEAVEKGILEETLNHVFLNLFLSLGVAKLYQTKKINVSRDGTLVSLNCILEPLRWF